MPEPAPEHLHALRLARDGAVFEGNVALSAMPRLKPLLSSDRGAAAYSLDFHLDAASRPVVDGEIRACVALVCQRCLEPMTADLALDVRLGIVLTEDEAVALSEDREPLLLKTETVTVGGLVEDELILGLPPSPLHPPGRCRPPGSAETVAPEAPRGDNPFAVLEAVKSKHGKHGA